MESLDDPAGGTAGRDRSGAADRIHALWDELADFPAAQSDDALLHLMRTMCGWLAADNAMWVGAVRIAHGNDAARDPQSGWRGRVVRRLVTPPGVEEITRHAMRTQGEDAHVDMTTRALTAGAGAFRIHRMHDGFIDIAAFRETVHYRLYYQGLGIEDRIWAVSPVNPHAESYLVFDRHTDGRRFSAADAALVRDVLRGLKWFQRNLLLNHGLPIADAPLSPMQRRVLALLLTDKSEKEIAHELSLTPGSAHQYVVEIYRKFRVRSRAGLMALWITGAPLPTDQ